MIVLRGGAERLEVLMAQRTPKARFMGGAWVFPGGAVDAHEGEGDARTARRPCARSRRRSAITLPDPAALVPFARWITPPEVAIRFDTYFFLAVAPDGAEAMPDGSEIVDARWFEPARALEGSEAGELLMVFPTIKNLELLAALRHRRRAARVGGRRTRSSPSSRASRARARRRGSCSMTKSDRLTVAVTGPTGRASGARSCARSTPTATSARVLGMARRAVRPGALGLARPSTARATCSTATPSTRSRADADVLVHLAFIILGGRDETRAVNLDGLAQRVRAPRRDVKRLVYTSSVAAYGFHADNPQPLTEDVPPRGSDALLLLGAEGRARARCSTSRRRRHARPTCSGRASSPGRTR